MSFVEIIALFAANAKNTLLNRLIYAILPVFALIALSAEAQTNISTVNVDGLVQHQTIEGLGGGMESHDGYANDTQFWDMLFKDVGVSAVRTGSSSQSDLASLNSPQMNEVIWPVYRLAKNYGQTIFGAYIHAKPEWKSPPITNGGTLLPEFYDDYANYMVDAINIYENTAGVTISLNWPIPEPSLGSNGDPNSPYLHTYMSPSDYRDLIKVYGPILKNAKPNIKIYAPLDWNVDGSIYYTNIILSDPEARMWIDGLATNGYGTTLGVTTPQKWQSFAALAKQYNLSEIWVPEQSHCCSNEAADPVGLVMAGWLHDALAFGNVNLWQTWLLIDKGKYNRDNMRGLVFSKFWPCVNGVCEFSANGITKDGYAFKQFAHWVRPGAIRVDASSDNSEILVTSYLHPLQDTFTIVAINKGSSGKTVNFNIGNVQRLRNLDIFRTSASENTANLGRLSVLNNSFSYILPAQSITTFAGSTGAYAVILALTPGGADSESSIGLAIDLKVGYAKLVVNSGGMPYGTAVFSFKQNGVTVTQAGVPASPPTALARVFIDYRSDVLALPGQSNSGILDINTGIAVANTSTATANVTYTLRDIAGTILAVGNGTIAAGAHFAKFIDQLTDVAPNFSLPSSFQNTTQFGSLEIAGDQPLSILALRGTNNQRNDFLITTTPVADLMQPLGNSSSYLPQFVDGGGYTTSLVLLNTSGVVETGTLEILDDNGAPLIVQLAGGTARSSFRYSIQPNGAFRLQTDGSPTNINRGWVRLIPDTGNSTPIGSGIFAYNPVDMLLSESGIPAAVSTNHARIFADISGYHNTGLAIANIAGANASIAISAFQMDGITPVGTSQGPLPLSAYGHDAKFADQFISGLPTGFTGVLDISSTTPFAALTIRSLLNERHDFLMTTFPIADTNATAPSPIVFPQVADGGGYVTQFIFISPTGASSATLDFWDETGAPLAIGR
jgi:O-glycosyl hydrolase